MKKAPKHKMFRATEFVGEAGAFYRKARIVHSKKTYRRKSRSNRNEE